VWNRALPHPEARGVQPIQTVQHLVVAGFQDPSDDSILVQCYDSRQGEAVWETRLGSAARDVAVLQFGPGDSKIVARTDASGMFVLSANPTSGGWKSRRSIQPAASSPVRFTDDLSDMVFVSDGGTRLNRFSLRDWGKVESRNQSPPITSDLALFRGDFAISGELFRPTQSGRWVLFVTADRSIELFDPDEQNGIHGVRIPAVQPADQPWRWSPLVLQSYRPDDGKRDGVVDTIVGAHPSGIVCRAELRRTEEITHLFVTECRKDLPPLAAPPVEFHDAVLCVGADGKCVLLDSTTLRTVSDWQASGPIGTVATVLGTAFLMVDRSTVQALESRDGKLVAGWQRQLDGGDWQIARVERDNGSRLFAFSSSGEIVALDPSSGQTVWSFRAPASLALPPQWVGNELLLATIDGGLFFVPDLGRATRGIEK
jgi:outer membrane protein assembly factor BamB